MLQVQVVEAHSSTWPDGVAAAAAAAAVSPSRLACAHHHDFTFTSLRIAPSQAVRLLDGKEREQERTRQAHGAADDERGNDADATGEATPMSGQTNAPMFMIKEQIAVELRLRPQQLERTPWPRFTPRR